MSMRDDDVEEIISHESFLRGFLIGAVFSMITYCILDFLVGVF